MCVCVRFLFSLWKGPLARGAYVTKARDSIEGMACCAHPPDDDADVMRILFFFYFFVFLQSKFTRIVEDVDKYKNNFQCARVGWGVSGEKWRKSESEIKKNPNNDYVFKLDTCIKRVDAFERNEIIIAA